MGRAGCMVLAGMLALAVPGVGAAQDGENDGWGDEEGASAETGSEAEAEAEADPESEPAEESESESESEPESAGANEPRSWYFGAYVQYSLLPAFWLELFLAEAPTVANIGPVGAAVNLWNGDGGPSIQFGIGYTSYAFEDPFRAKGDPVQDTEWVESDLGLVHLTGSLLWNSAILSNLHFEYGFGLNFGIVTGELVRTEARPGPTGGFVPCQSQFDIEPPGVEYCEAPSGFQPVTNAYDEDGAHYHVVDESVPPVMAMPILPHLAIRYEPIQGLALKFETALFPLFSFGISAAYAPF